ncbi:MAG: hypothetical protein M3Y52_08265 [Actinomycetota bacterium]|nr:hypothetical protein [Actinomycetota bacterium]
MTGALDVLRENLGHGAGPELIHAIDTIPQRRLDELAEEIAALEPTQKLPVRPVTEVWPLVPMRSSLFFDRLGDEVAAGFASTGIRLSAATDPRLAGTGVFSGGVLSALLYSHGLAIEDPLRHAAGMHLSQTDELRPITRRGLSAAASSLSEIAELLDAGVVSLFYTEATEVDRASAAATLMVAAVEKGIPGFSQIELWESFESEFVAGLSLPLQHVWREVREGNRSPDLELVRRAAGDDPVLAETFVEVLSMLRPETILENAIEATASSLAIITQLGGGTDVLASSDLMRKLLFIGAPDPVEQVRVHELARVAVPNIDELSPRDLIRIRSDSDALATWRTDLASALDYADRQRKVGVDSSTIGDGIEEMMAGSRRRLRKEAASSAVWTARNVVNFIAGALGGAGGAAIGGSTGAVVAASAAGGAVSLVQAIAERERVPHFLDRHYLAFSPRAEP